MRALEGIDVVFHCAALKHVEAGEYNPFEATQTNVVGTQNVIDACLATGVRTMILTSSDKAANPDLGDGREQATRREARERGDELPRALTRQRSPASGSVTSSGRAARRLKLFARQIAAGGPVTVTDPDDDSIRR